MKECLKCRELRPISAFGRNATSADGLQIWCNQCREHWSRTPNAIAQSKAVRKRTSPYQRMAEVLREIEVAMTIGPNTVQATIDAARVKYSL